MALKLSTLFKPKGMPQNVNAPVQNQNTDAKRSTETYLGWGQRICATTFASDAVLQPFLMNVYNYIKREQAQDEAYQQTARAEYQAKIAQNNNNIALSQTTIDISQKQIDANINQIKQKGEEKLAAQQKTFKVNRDAKAKMLIGLIILVPLTIYLFMFYSSTFYSAFLAGNGSGITDASSAMFRADAFGAAYEKSIFSLFLMIVFPIVFMGLGFILHYFSKDSEDKMKYVKMATIILVTFAFDCILAYKIGETIHNSLVNNDLIPESIYTLGMAVKDVSFWAVIFCGFIAYIIWGLVYDLVQDGYEKLDQNKLDIQAINNQVSQLQIANQSLQAVVSAENQKITNWKNENEKIQISLIGTTFFNEGAIRTEMTNFFSGWIAQMAILGKTTNSQGLSRGIFDQTMVSLGLTVVNA